jgi:DNA mismatch repair protein MutS
MSGVDSPMFKQYFRLKEQHPDCLLFFRMGDFYELFFDDAVVVSELLELTLTSRNKNDPDPIPMAGVPHHAVRGPIQSLLEQGFKVAIADQVQDPREARGLVDREVVRVVTPGVGLDPDDLAPREAAWLVGLHRERRRWGVALLDVSTGELRVTEMKEESEALDELSRVEPREVVLSESLAVSEAFEAALKGTAITLQDEGNFEVDAAIASLCEHFEVADLSGFGCKGLRPALAAAWAVLDYATRNARSELPHLSRIRPYTVSHCMVLDPATRRNLELTRPLRGTGRKGTLVALLDRTSTAMGGRLLRDWLAYPLLDLDRIRARQDGVEALAGENTLRRELRLLLKSVADLERIGGKIAQATAGARDLAALRGSLEALPRVFELLKTLPAFAALVPRDLAQDVARDIGFWLREEPPVQITEGGVIREGAHEGLDELIALSRDGKAMVAAMEDREREATGISSLKIRYNRVMGYYLDITRANLHRVPDHYLRKQTLKNNERYFTPELKEFEEKILHADERRKALEYELFCELRERVSAALPRLQSLARMVAAVDALGALAEVAVDYRYVRPEVNDGRDLVVVGGRHPVVEQVNTSERFVPNDVKMHHDGRRVLIVTGPNMSGKSTVMRQVALIVLLAQIGSFVPAESAVIGLCDRIFTRVGASDDLAGGQSTFMVEMSETANILHHATDRSLVVLDEIGRGTSTYDGLAIAWAVAEAMHDRIRCRCMFATHYHELVELADSREHVANISVSVSEWGEKIVFLRTLKEGGASRSYGIQCARLAGMPKPVISRARELLKRLERHASANPHNQISLFEVREAPGEPPEPEPPPAAPSPDDKLREALALIDPNTLSPFKALEVIFHLKSLA